METNDAYSLLNMLMVFAGVVVSGCGLLFGVYKLLNSRINEVDKMSGIRTKDVHQRLDRLAENSVRRDEIMGHFNRIEGQMASQTDRLDKIMEALMRPGAGNNSAR